MVSSMLVVCGWVDNHYELWRKIPCCHSSLSLSKCCSVPTIPQLSGWGCPTSSFWTHPRPSDTPYVDSPSVASFLSRWGTTIISLYVGVCMYECVSWLQPYSAVRVSLWILPLWFLSLCMCYCNHIIICVNCVFMVHCLELRGSTVRVRYVGYVRNWEVPLSRKDTSLMRIL